MMGVERNYKERHREWVRYHECGKYLTKGVTGYELPNLELIGKGSYSTGNIR